MKNWDKPILEIIDARCSACGESIDNRVHSGKNLVCFDCKKKRRKEYYRLNKEHILAVKKKGFNKKNI